LEEVLQLFDFAEKPLAFAILQKSRPVDCEALRQGGFRAKARFFGRIRSLQHFLIYLFALMDWYSRYVLEWELSNTLENDFCVRALKKYANSNVFLSQNRLFPPISPDCSQRAGGQKSASAGVLHSGPLR
jgi:hypothetical protein